MSEDIDDFEPDVAPPEDGKTFSCVLDQCHDCMNFKIRFMRPLPTDVDDNLSKVFWLEVMQGIYCKKGRIRLANGDIKVYKTKRALDRSLAKEGETCPDYEPDEEVE